MIAFYSFFGDSSLIGKFDVKALQRCTQHLGTAEGQWSTLMLWVPVAMPRAYFPGVDTQCALPGYLGGILQHTSLSTMETFLYIVEVRCWSGCGAMGILFLRAKSYAPEAEGLKFS